MSSIFEMLTNQLSEDSMKKISSQIGADEGGAGISGQPLALASALAKLHRGVQSVPLQHGNPAHSHMFIMNPFFGGLQRFFSTHPPAEERIRRLQLLAGGGSGQS